MRTNKEKGIGNWWVKWNEGGVGVNQESTGEEERKKEKERGAEKNKKARINKRGEMTVKIEREIESQHCGCLGDIVPRG